MLGTRVLDIVLSYETMERHFTRQLEYLIPLHRFLFTSTFLHMHPRGIQAAKPSQGITLGGGKQDHGKSPDHQLPPIISLSAHNFTCDNGNDRKSASREVDEQCKSTLRGGGGGGGGGGGDTVPTEAHRLLFNPVAKLYGY
jgi:hypothetical protein